MESPKKVIEANFFSLIGSTTISLEFLLKFKAKHVFNFADIKAIMIVKEYTTQYDQAFEFYKRILVTSASRAYEVLLEALKDTRQTAPLEILHASVFGKEIKPPPLQKLHFGSPDRCQEILLYLIEAGQAKLLKTKDENGATLLHTSVLYIEVKKETIQRYRALGISLNEVDKFGQNVFMYAVQGGRSRDYLTKLMRLEADWKKVDNGGNTVLHIAARNYNGVLINFFMDLGSDPEVKNKEGVTALDLAIKGIKPDSAENILAINRLLLSRVKTMRLHSENAPVVTGSIASLCIKY